MALDSIVLRGGNHQLDQTLTVANVEGLIMRSAENAVSIIKCSHPANSDDTRSGLVFANLRNSNIHFEGCGTLQYSTTLRNNKNTKFRSAVYLTVLTCSSASVSCTGTLVERCPCMMLLVTLN